jgi:hypothetical protein
MPWSSNLLFKRAVPLLIVSYAVSCSVSRHRLLDPRKQRSRDPGISGSVDRQRRPDQKHSPLNQGRWCTPRVGNWSPVYRRHERVNWKWYVYCTFLRHLGANPRRSNQVTRLKNFVYHVLPCSTSSGLLNITPYTGPPGPPVNIFSNIIA